MDCACVQSQLCALQETNVFVCSSLLSKTDWRSSIALFHDMKQFHGFEVPPDESTANQHVVREDIA